MGEIGLPWLPVIPRSFKRHRMGQPGRLLEFHRDKLRRN